MRCRIAQTKENGSQTGIGTSGSVRRLLAGHAEGVPSSVPPQNHAVTWECEFNHAQGCAGFEIRAMRVSSY